MTRKQFSLAMTVALIANMIFVLPAVAAPPQPENPQPIYQGDVIDIGPVLRAKDLPIMGAPDISLAHSLDIQATQAYTVGDELTWLALDDYYGYYFFTTYTVMTITQHAEVWVQNDLNYYNTDNTLNTIHPDASDPQYVTEDEVNYLAETFDDLIYPTDTDFFGLNDSLDGTYGFEGAFGIPELDADDGSRVVVLVSNVRDTNFYDPVASGSYIAGFYSPTYEHYSDRNMITIDSKQWHERVGDGGERLYLYDSVLAHEFQHLIHDDYSPNEDTWPNEGMSGFAEFLNGYWFEDELGGRTEWQTWPENSLVLWGDQNSDQGGSEILADYQLTNAFALYTTRRIGGTYTDTAKLTQEPTDGILGFNNWLSDTAQSPLRFEDIFEDFRVDMLYGGDSDGAQPVADWSADFISGYESPLEQAGGPATAAANLGVLRDNLDREGYDTAGVPPFGTDFIEVCWSETVSTTSWLVDFDGDEAPAPSAWSVITATDIYTPSGSVTGDVLHSGHSNLTDNFVIFGPITPTGGEQLTFDHFYNIEGGGWDYGFVQVTTDTTGMTGWTSLDMTGTITVTDSSCHPIIAANVPGFAGFSGGWITATYDIAAGYADESILLAFRYSTDWAADGSTGSYPSGWAIDNVEIGSTTLTDGSTKGQSIQEVRNAGNRFAFEFLTWGDGDTITVTNVHTVSLSAAMTGTIDLAPGALSDTGFDEAGERGVFMVSLMTDVFDDLIAGGMVAEYADYSLTGVPPSICTSDINAYGNTHAGARRVYAGEVVTVAVHADNIGSSPNITTTAPMTFYIGVEVPTDTTYLSASGGAVYTTSLQTVSASFPNKQGVYWIGLVTDTYDFDATFTANSTLVNEDIITATVHFADGAGTDQYIVEEDTVEVVSAFSLSGLQADVDPVFPGINSQFTAKVLNLSHNPKSVQLVADNPTDTTFMGVTGATVVATSTTQITVTQTITPYATSGAVDVTFQWLLGSPYDFGDVVTSTMKLTDLTTGETVDLSVTADVDASYRLYLPLVMRNS